MQTQDIKFRDDVKAELDRECWEDTWYTCPTRRFSGKDKKPGTRDHSETCHCWQCHRNDALADRIAEIKERH